MMTKTPTLSPEAWRLLLKLRKDGWYDFEVWRHHYRELTSNRLAQYRPPTWFRTRILRWGPFARIYITGLGRTIEIPEEYK